MSSDSKAGSAKKLGFSEVHQYIPATRTLSEKEERKRHEAQEEFESKRGQNICSSVFGVLFFCAGCVLFWAAAEYELRDIYIIGGVVLFIGLVLLVISIFNIIRICHRAKDANNKVMHQELPRSSSVNSALKKDLRSDSFVTQSDVSVRGLSPPPEEVRKPTHAQLYSTAAIKSDDIEKFKANADLKQQNQEQQTHRNNHSTIQKSQSRTVIQLGVNSEHGDADHKDDVVIIHDAKIALPNPVYQQEGNHNNTSYNNNTKPSFFLETVEAHVMDIPGTPDLPVEETDHVVPDSFTYEPPNSSSTDL